MNGNVFSNLFEDQLVIKKVKNKLSHLFQLAEIENSRNGKIGMEIGSTRERILVALLMYKFGIDDVNVKIPITEPEIDVFVKNQPLSIKTVTTTNNRWNGSIKLIWTVDKEKALYFKTNYTPKCDIMLAKIQWGSIGKLLLFTKTAQEEVLKKINRNRYIKLPAQGINSRGVEITQLALEELEKHMDTKSIEIDFVREDIDCREAYTKWLDAWHEDH